jgi:TolA-binding protein
MKSLINSYPRSNLSDDARFEIAQSNVKMQNTNEAIENLKKLMSEYPQSNRIADAYLQLGLLYYNIDNTSEAIRYYKETIRLFPASPQSKDALIGLKNIYVDMNKVDDYFAYVKSSGQTAPYVSVNEQDSLIYISAEKVYMNGDCSNSSRSFERYISSYPQGNYLLNAHFYKADCNYRNKEFDKAEVSFNYVLAQPVNQFTEQSLLGIARIEIQNKEFLKAIDHYQQLINNYPNPGNSKEALVAIMETQFTLKNYEEAVNASVKVVEISKIGPEIERRAYYIGARSLQELGREALAIDDYKKISGEVMSSEGAESKFRLAEIYYNQKDYKNAEKEILELSEKTTAHEYWIARSFILWADIFVVNKDYFQAIQTLQSIIDYYAKTDDGILKMAKDKKAEIVKLQEVKEQPKPSEEVEIKID